MTTATSFDLCQRKCLTLHVLAPRKFQHTRRINKKRWQPFLPYCDSGQSARNTNAYSPRHKFLSASSCSWLSVRANHHHDTPPRHVVLSGKKSEARVADVKVLVVKSTESESNLPESLARCHGKRSEFIFPLKMDPFWCSCNAEVKMHVRKKDSEMSCVIGAVKKSSIQCARL